MIEVGSFDGSDSLVFYNRGYEVFTFEPKKDLFHALKIKTGHLSGYTPINKAVSLVDGELDFHICVQGGASSILPFKSDAELDTHWTPARKDIHYSGISYKVQSTRLDTFFEENGLTTRNIDYIHIDAQGSDLDVLRSAGKYISNIQSGVLETCYSLEKSIYSEQRDDLNAVKSWLESNGFVIERVVPNDPTGCECNVYFKRA